MAARLQAIHMLALIACIVKKNFDLMQVTFVGYGPIGLTIAGLSESISR